MSTEASARVGRQRGRGLIRSRVVEPDAAGSARAGTADAGHLKRYFLVLCVAMMLAGLAYRGVSLVLPATFELETSFLDSVLQRLRSTELQGVQNLAATLIASGVGGTGGSSPGGILTTSISV